MSKNTKTNLTTYGERALTFFVTNNNKLKRIFHDTDDWDKVMSLVDETFVYTEEQYNHLKQKFDKATTKVS
jgi:hypothetical protein